MQWSKAVDLSNLLLYWGNPRAFEPHIQQFLLFFNQGLVAVLNQIEKHYLLLTICSGRDITLIGDYGINKFKG
jgi:hypothetical protein